MEGYLLISHDLSESVHAKSGTHELVLPLRFYPTAREECLTYYSSSFVSTSSEQNLLELKEAP